MNLVAKLLLNSLYGRFAMKQILTVQGLYSQAEFNEIVNKYEIEDSFVIKDEAPATPVHLISYIDPKLGNKKHNISISIASAVTSYARVVMSVYKKPSSPVNLLYTDTDSIFVD